VPHRRVWAGGILLLVAGLAALVLLWGGRLQVTANIDKEAAGWPRSGILVFSFNQDMDRGSVERGFRVSPAVPYEFQALSPRRFQFTPQFKADTSYDISIDGAKPKTGPFSVGYHRRLHTAIAPAVAQVTLQGQPLTEGQTRVPLQPVVAVRFTQPMDPATMRILVDEQPLTGLAWDKDYRVATVSPSWQPAHTYALAVKAGTPNARHDGTLGDFTVHFRTVVQLPSTGQHVLNGPPALVQIDNAPFARPQAGLQGADLVYEYLTEYDISRFTAVFFSDPPALVGPVRSARLVSIPLQQSLQGALFCSGAGDYVLGQLWAQKIPMHINDYSAGGVFFRDNRRFAPHNLMLPGPALDQHRRDFQLPTPGYVLAPAAPDQALPGASGAPAISVPSHGVRWQASGSEYLRWDDGRPFGDANTGQQVHAKNVIIQFVPTRLTDIVEDVNGGAKTLQYELTGEGRALYYANGGVVEGRWRHPDAKEPVEYLDAAGNLMRLNSGLTWVHVVSQ
jgi:hypothetical protein